MERFGQINAQLLYDVSPGTVPLRVRTPSGVSQTVEISVGAVIEARARIDVVADRVTV